MNVYLYSCVAVALYLCYPLQLWGHDSSNNVSYIECVLSNNTLQECRERHGDSVLLTGLVQFVSYYDTHKDKLRTLQSWYTDKDMDSLPLGTFIIKSGRRFVDTTYVYKSSVATILLKAYSWIYMIYNNYPEHNLDRNHNVGLWNENDKAFFYDYSRTNFNKYDHGGNESDSESVEFNSHHHYKAMHEKLKAWIPLFWNFGLESMRLKKISPLVDGVYPKLFSSTDKELNTRLLEAIARDSTMSQAEKDEWLPTKVNCLDSMRSNMPRR